MVAVPKKVAKRLATQLKSFQPILESARDRDINESDTVVIVTDVLSKLLGYDKYSEITSEYAIRRTFCDIAIIVQKNLRFIIEVKAIGIELKEKHIKQAVDYAANQGVDWTILTNGINWKVFRVTFGKPIDKELILEIDILKLNPNNSADIENLFLLAREGLKKSVLAEYQTQLQATNRFILGALFLSEPVLKVVRKELKRLSPDVKIDIEEIRHSIMQEVLKRDVVVGDEAVEAQKKVKKLIKKQKKTRAKKRDKKKAEYPEKITEADNNVKLPVRPQGFDGPEN